jgi:hypothetical protein
MFRVTHIFPVSLHNLQLWVGAVTEKLIIFSALPLFHVWGSHFYGRFPALAIVIRLCFSGVTHILFPQIFA